MNQGDRNRETLRTEEERKTEKECYREMCKTKEFLTIGSKSFLFFPP